MLQVHRTQGRSTGEPDELRRRSNQVDRSSNIRPRGSVRRENVSTLRTPVAIAGYLPRVKERETGGTGTQKRERENHP